MARNKDQKTGNVLHVLNDNQKLFYHALDKQMFLDNFNTRAENRGRKEKVSAIDIRLQNTENNAVLNLFDTHLLKGFYRKVKSGEQIGTEGAGALNQLIMPEFHIIEWARKEMHNYTMQLSYAVSGVMLETQVRLSKFVLDMREGGSVIVTHNASFCPTPAEIAILWPLLKKDVTISLIPPEDVELVNTAPEEEETEEETQEEETAAALAEQAGQARLPH